VILESQKRTDDDGTLDVRTPPDGMGVIPVARARGLPGYGQRYVIVDSACSDLVGEALARSQARRTTVLDLGSPRASRPTAMLGKAAAVVLGCRLEGGLPSAEAIVQIRSMHPHIGIYVVANHVAEVARQLPALAAAGVDEVFCRDAAGDMNTFQETLSRRVAAPAPVTEMRLIWKWFRDTPERSLVMHCVRNAFRDDDWTIRTRVFGACRRTLQNRVAGLGLPSPGLLARFGRVLHAQELERRGLGPTSLVAHLVGLPSASALHRARRRLRKSLVARGRQSLVLLSLLT
jgi:hypothetical protein